MTCSEKTEVFKERRNLPKWINHADKSIVITTDVLSKGAAFDVSVGRLQPHDVRWQQFRYSTLKDYKKLLDKGYKVVFKHENKKHLIIYNK